MGIVWIGRNPVAVPSRLQRVGEIRLTHPLPVLRTGPAGEPAAATRRPAMCRIGIRLCQKAMPANAPHGIGKPTANRDLTPLATANGYRPADGLGVVIKHGSRGRPASLNKESITPKPEDIAILRLASRFWHTRCGLSGRCFRCCGCWWCGKIEVLVSGS